jgi:gamma-glutamylcyclotransferase (GGCT)/AIG2-like uncharacterized protein YtfP
MILFLYGTLLDAQTLARRGGVAGLGGMTATLTGWRRVTVRHTRYPTLRRARGQAVTGRVVRVPAAAMRRLTAYEGPSYRLMRLVVVTQTGAVAAWTWVAAAATHRDWNG